MVTLKYTKNLEVDMLEAGDLVAQVLQEDFEFICKEVRELQSKQDLRPHEAEDLANSISVRDAMKTLMGYYMTHTDYTEYMEMQRMFGNVA